LLLPRESEADLIPEKTHGFLSPDEKLGAVAIAIELNTQPFLDQATDDDL